MGATLDSLLKMVKDSVLQHTEEQKSSGFDPGKLLGHLDQIFGQHAQQQRQGSSVLPASQDPYGDPANEGSGGGRPMAGNVKPASQDPYGDPADEGRSRNR